MNSQSWLYFADQLADVTNQTVKDEAVKAVAALFGSNDEPDGIGYCFSTQSIAGAGGSKVGIAGSVAIAIINGKTQAIIASRTARRRSGVNDIIITGNTTIVAWGVQVINTTAGSTADKEGAADKGKDKGAASTAGTETPPAPEPPPGEGTGSSSSVGIGASFAFSLPDFTVDASIGENRKVSSGSLALKAMGWDDVDTIAVAGGDPLARKDEVLGALDTDEDGEISETEDPGGKTQAANNTTSDKISVDAAVALGLISHTVTATIGTGVIVTTTGTDDILTADDKLVNFQMLARLDGRTLTDGKGNASGSIAVGAAVAINIVDSTVQTDFLGTGTIAGSALIEALTATADDSHALATAMGADTKRYADKFKKLGTATQNDSSSTMNTKLNANANSEDSKTDSTNQPTGALAGAPASTNALHTQDVSTDNAPPANDAQKEVNENVDPQPTEADKGDGTAPATTQPQVPGQTSQSGKMKLHIAAAVAVNITNHKALVNISGTLSAARITVRADSAGNFQTLGSGITASMPKATEEDTANIGLGVAVSVNKSQAIVTLGGSITATGISETPAEDRVISVTAELTQNLDGQYRGLLGAQALAGSISGKTKVGLAGAVAVLVAMAKSGVVISDGATITGGALSFDATDKSKLAVRAGAITFAKGAKVAAGASFAVIYGRNQVYVLVGDATITAVSLRLNAARLAVTLADYDCASDLADITGSDLLPISLTDDSENKDGKSFSLNLDNISVDDIIDNLSLLNFLSSANYYAEAIAGTVVTGNDTQVALAGSFAMIFAYGTVMTTIADGAKVTLTGALDADASSATNARIISGALSGSKAQVGVGLTVGFLLDNQNVLLQLGGCSNVNGYITAGSLTADAKATDSAQVITVAAAVSTTGNGIGGSINLILNECVVTAEVLPHAAITADKGIHIHAASDNSLLLIALSITYGGGTVAAGGTGAIIIDTSAIKAITGDDVTLTSTYGDIELLSESKARLIAILASASGARGTVGVAGTLSVLVSRSTTEASVGADSHLTAGTPFDPDHPDAPKDPDDLGFNIRIMASSDVWMLAVLAAVVGGTSTVTVGATINVFVFKRTVTAAVGDRSVLAASGDILVQALAKDWDCLVSAAGSFTSGTAGISGVIVVVAGKSIVKANTGISSNLSANGSIGLIAHQDSTFYNAALSVGVGSTAGVGVTLIAVFLDNDVEAETGTDSVLTAWATLPTTTHGITRPNRADKRRGIVISATATENYILVAVSGAGGGTGAGAGVIQALVIRNRTKAIVGDRSTIKVGDTDNAAAIAADDTGILVEADDETHLWNCAGSLAVGGTAGVGATAVILIFNKTVLASIGSEREPDDTSAANSGESKSTGDIHVTANAHDDLQLLAITFAAAGTVAVGIGGNMIYFKNTVGARVSGTLDAHRDVLVQATSDSLLVNVAVSAMGAGAVAVGGAVVITYFSAQTTASAAAESEITAKGAVVLKAASAETVSGDAAGFAVSGTVSVSGTVVVNLTNIVTRAYTEDDVTITGEKLDILADDIYRVVCVVGSVAVSGTVGVGVTAMVCVAANTVSAEIGENNIIETTGTASYSDEAPAGITVRAQSDRQILAYAINEAGGQVGVGVTLMTVVIGGKLTQDSADNLRNEDSDGNSHGFDSDGFGSEMAASAPSGARDDINEQKSGMGSMLAGDGSLQSDTSAGTTKDGKTNFDGTTGYRDSEEDPAPDDLSGDDSSNADLTAASGKYNNLPSYESKDTTMAKIGTGSVLTSASDITVKAMDNLTADLLTGTVAVGVYAGVGVGIAVAVLYSNVLALVEDGATLSADGNIVIQAAAGSTPVPFDADQADINAELEDSLEMDDGSILDLTIRAISITGSGAIAAISAAIASVTVTSRIIARLAGDVIKADSLTVKAISSYPDIMTVTLAAGTGGVAVNISLALVVVNSQIESSICGDAAISGVVNGENAGTINVLSDITVGAQSAATAFAAGAAAINGALALAVNRLRADTFIGQGVQITGTNTDINLDTSASVSADALIISVALSQGISVNIAPAIVVLKPIVLTYIGATPGAGVSTYAALTHAASLNPSDYATGLIQARDITVQNALADDASATAIGLAYGSVSLNGLILLVFDQSIASAAISRANIEAVNITINAGQDAMARAFAASAAIGTAAIGINITYVQLRADNRALLDATQCSIAATGDIAVHAGQADLTPVTNTTDAPDPADQTNNNTFIALADAISGNAGIVAVGFNVAIADLKAANRSQVIVASLVSALPALKVDGGLTVDAWSQVQARATVTGLGAGVASIMASFTVALLRNTQETSVSGSGCLEAGTLTVAAHLNENNKTAALSMITAGSGGLVTITALVAAAYGRSTNKALVTIKHFFIYGAVDLLSSGSAIVGAKTDNVASVSVVTAAVMVGLTYGQSEFEASLDLPDSSDHWRDNLDWLDAYAGSVSISTDANFQAWTNVKPSSGGVSAGYYNIKVNTATAILTAENNALLKGAGTLYIANNLLVDATGIALAQATITAPVLTVSGLSVAANVGTATQSASQTASISGLVIWHAANVTVQSILNQGQSEGATVVLGGNNAGVGISVALISADANAATALVSATNTAAVDKAVITASGLLKVESIGTSYALSTVKPPSAALSFAGVGITNMYAQANGSFTSYIDTNTSGVISARDIIIRTTYTAKADALAVQPNGGSGGVDLSVLSVKVNLAEAIVGVIAQAYGMGTGELRSSNDILVAVQGTANALADIPGTSFSLSGITIGANNTLATISASQSATISDATVKAGRDVKLLSLLNRTESVASSTDSATASVGGNGVSGEGVSLSFVGVTENSATALMSATTSAFTNNAHITAGGAVQILSLTHARANAVVRSDAAFGFVAIGAAITTASVTESTKAYATGEAYIRGDSLRIEATALDEATATTSALSGGALNISGNFATAIITSTVEAYAGSSSDILTAGDIAILASVTPDADASVSGTNVGLFNAGVSSSIITIQPTVNAYIGDSSTVVAGAQLLTGSPLLTFSSAAILSGTPTITFIKNSTMMTGGPTLSFAPDATNGDKITRSSGSWLTDGFKANDYIYVAGTTNMLNDNAYQIASLTDTVLTLTDKAVLIAETNVSDVTVSTGSPNEIRRSSGNWLSDGFEPGQVITVSGAANSTNNGSFEILAISADGLTMQLSFGTVNVNETAPATIVIRAETADRIYRDSGSWHKDGFTTGQIIRIFDTSTNDGIYEIAAISADGRWLTLTSASKFTSAVDSDVALSIISQPDGTSLLTDPSMGSGIQGVLSHAPDRQIVFTDKGVGNRDEISRNSGSWLTDGFAAGQYITICGTVNNDLTYQVDTISSDGLILYLAMFCEVANETINAYDVADEFQLVTETAASSYQFSSQAALNELPDQTIIFTDKGGSLRDEISRSIGSWLLDGFLPGQSIVITGTQYNTKTYQIDAISRDGLVLYLNSANAVTNETVVVETASAAFQIVSDTADRIYRSGGSWSDDGFKPGQDIRVFGSENNDGTYSIDKISADGRWLTLVSLASLQPEYTTSVAITIPLRDACLTVMAMQFLPEKGSGFGETAFATATASASAEDSPYQLIGVNATIVTITDTSTVKAWVGNASILNVAAVAEISAYQLGSLKAVGKSENFGLILALGANIVNVTATDTIEATIGNNIDVFAGLFKLTAYGSNNSYAEATCSASGIAAGSAAAASTDSTSTTLAKVGTDTDIQADDVQIVAEHTADYNSKVDSSSSNLVGASGAFARNDVTATVVAEIGARTTIKAYDILVSAVNMSRKEALDSAVNAKAGAGGIADFAAARSHTDIAQITGVTIGDNADLTLIGDKYYPGTFRLQALNDIFARDKASLDARAAISVARAESLVHARIDDPDHPEDPAYSTPIMAAVTIGNGVHLTSVGDINLSARTIADILTDAYAYCSGGAGYAQGKAESLILCQNEVTVGGNAHLFAEGNINLLAGRNSAAQVNAYTLTANALIDNYTAFPVGNKPTGNAILNQTNNITVAGGALLESVKDANLLADPGIRILTGWGVGHDFYRSLVGAEIRNEQTAMTDNSTVTVNGTIKVGIRNIQHLEIDSNGDVTHQSDGVTFTKTQETLGNALTAELARLKNLAAQYCGTQAEAGFNAQIQFVLADLRAKGYVVTLVDGVYVVSADIIIDVIIVDDIWAQSANINVTGKSFIGTGILSAPGNAEILVTNASLAYLRLNRLTIPGSEGGNLNFNGNAMSGTTTTAINAAINLVNVNKSAAFSSITTSATSAEPQITVRSTHSQPGAPDITLAGAISNVGTVARPGTVTITSTGGINSLADINAGTLSINASGNFVQSYIDTFYSIGGETRIQWSSVGRRREQDTKSRLARQLLALNYPSQYGSAEIAFVDGLINGIVNGTSKQDANRSELRAANIFIAARYLNINGLIEAGHATQEITLGTDIATKIANFKKQVLSRNYLDYLLVQKSDMKFYYDPVNNRILLDDVSVYGGYIELFGQIISTSTGKISALDGFGTIKVVNNYRLQPRGHVD